MTETQAAVTPERDALNARAIQLGCSSWAWMPDEEVKIEIEGYELANRLLTEHRELMARWQSIHPKSEEYMKVYVLLTEYAKKRHAEHPQCIPNSDVLLGRMTRIVEFKSGRVYKGDYVLVEPRGELDGFYNKWSLKIWSPRLTNLGVMIDDVQLM